jgi:glycerol kinase
MVGITRGTNRGHFARATLEGIAFQVMDILKSMEADSGIDISELRVDGGAAANNLLMQFQSELLRVPVIRPKQLETTALGAAYLAGLAVGFWESVDQLNSQWTMEKEYIPEAEKENMQKLIFRWENALARAKNWVEEE